MPKKIVLVIGHTNPDNDSIASAVAYAHLKNCVDPSCQYIPARLGPMPRESSWVFKRYGIDLPIAISHVHNRAREAMTSPVKSILLGTTMLEAGRLLKEAQVSSLVVLDDGASFQGIITLRALADFFIAQMDEAVENLQHGELSKDSFEALMRPIDSFVDSQVDTCSPDDLLDEVANFVLAPPYREAVVLDENRHCVGIVTRGDVARARKRDVILVDHNESSQAAPGIEEATVLEIVDHHRVGDIQTSSPILFLNLPLGSTATVVAQQYESLGVAIPQGIAAILLSAIMTDTLLLKSPTTTPVDHVIASKLGDFLELDPISFGTEVFRSRGGDQDAKAVDIIGKDSKEFRFGDHTVAIAQHETADLDSILSRSDELLACMNEKIIARGYDTLLLMVTDVIAEGSQFICAGDVRIVERAFDISLKDGGIWMPGVLSRKKQVASCLIEHGN